MKFNCVRLGVLVILLMCACKKNQLANPQITGNWNWISSGLGTQLTTSQNSGIQKSVAFKANGELIITHNDSTNSPLLPGFEPVVLLAGGAIKDTTTFLTRMEGAGCVNFQFPELVTGTGNGYQYSVSNDTLYISSPPCLAPFQSVFVKVN